MSKTTKFSIFSIITIVIVISAYLYASPYLALKNLKSAAEQNDIETINQYIDYPSVRQSLKDQLSAYMLEDSKPEKSNTLAKFGKMLANSMAEPLLDAVVTPTGIGLILQGKNLNPSHMSSNTPMTNDPQQAKEENTEYKLYYTSFNRFVIDVKSKQRHNQQVQVVMQREGLHWQIKQIIIPLD
jgi:hypothetical protein